VSEELGLTMYAPAGCGGRRGVRLVGLQRSGVIDESPFAAEVFVADDKVEGCEHGKEKSLELQESMTPVGGPFGVSERGPLGLGREDEGLVIGHSRLLRCCSMPLRCRAGWERKKKEQVLESSRTLPRELEELDALDRDDTRGCAGRR